MAVPALKQITTAIKGVLDIIERVEGLREDVLVAQ
jgi:hypothetical protein